MIEEIIQQALIELGEHWERDISYIRDFQNFIQEGEVDVYLPSFQNFVNEFRVNRGLGNELHVPFLNICRAKILEGIDLTLVDRIANEAKHEGLTNGFSDSLASKVCMLLDPIRFWPMDSRSKRALGLTSNNFVKHTLLMTRFITQNADLIDNAINNVELEAELNFDTNELIKVRFIDKYLWVCGNFNEAHNVFDL